VQWLQDLYARVVDHVENHPTPFERYLHLFFAVLAVRLALEFFSSHRLFTLDDVVHIGLWFVFIVLAFVLQLHLFSGERIEKVAKLVVVFYMFAWSAPILDLLTSRGVPARMNYLSLHSFRDIAWSYVTVGGSSMMRGATLGIRVEIVLLVLASFNYVRIKTGSVTRGLLGAWSIYTVLFLSGAVPLLLGLVVRGFRLAYRQGDQSTLLFLLTLDLALLFAAFWRHSARWMRQVMAAIPWGAGLVAVLLALLGAGLGSKGYPDNVRLDPTTLFWFALLPALLLCWGCGAPHRGRSGEDPAHRNRAAPARPCDRYDDLAADPFPVRRDLGFAVPAERAAPAPCASAGREERAGGPGAGVGCASRIRRPWGADGRLPPALAPLPARGRAARRTSRGPRELAAEGPPEAWRPAATTR
jgi:hypothetical protein